MSQTASRQSERAAGVFEQLSERFAAVCPPGYELQASVDEFYSGEAFWEKFRGWLANAPSLYVASDTAFVESAIDVDGARIINIGTFYPWAEIEWGARAAAWIGLDNNPVVLERARGVLREYPAHRVSFIEADITAPFDLGERFDAGRRFDAVLDLSTLDQLDPRRYRTILENYARLSDTLVLAYDATDEPLAVYDFEQCGFNALLNPTTMTAMLEQVGYRVLEHRPFAHKPYRSYVLATLGE
jgi:hypothetical protein